MKRLILVSLLSFACSRASRPAARPTATPATAPVVAAAPHDEHEEEEQRAIVNAARTLSSFDDTANGAKGFVSALAEAARGRDHARQERFEDELVADRDRFGASDGLTNRHIPFGCGDSGWAVYGDGHSENQPVCVA